MSESWNESDMTFFTSRWGDIENGQAIEWTCANTCRGADYEKRIAALEAEEAFHKDLIDDLRGVIDDTHAEFDACLVPPSTLTMRIKWMAERIAALEAENARLEECIPLDPPGMQIEVMAQRINELEAANVLLETGESETLKQLRADLAAARAELELIPKICSECGIYPADLPSDICSGCEAYHDHQA